MTEPSKGDFSESVIKLVEGVYRYFFYFSLSKDEIIYFQAPPAILLVAPLQYHQVFVAFYHDFTIFYQYLVIRIIKTVSCVFSQLQTVHGGVLV